MRRPPRLPPPGSAVLPAGARPPAEREGRLDQQAAARATTQAPRPAAPPLPGYLPPRRPPAHQQPPRRTGRGQALLVSPAAGTPPRPCSAGRDLRGWDGLAPSPCARPTHTSARGLPRSAAGQWPTSHQSDRPRAPRGSRAAPAWPANHAASGPPARRAGHHAIPRTGPAGGTEGYRHPPRAPPPRYAPRLSRPGVSGPFQPQSSPIPAAATSLGLSTAPQAAEPAPPEPNGEPPCPAATSASY